MPIAPDNVSDYLKEKNMEPVISRLSYEQRKRIDDAAPDRTVGMIAAYDYLNSKVKRIEMSTLVAVLFIIGIALAIGITVWGRCS